MKAEAAHLFEQAKKAAQNAHAPYSRFKVGAALIASNGKIYSGCNVENAAYPLGWCAEASAIAAMVGDGGKAIAEIAIIAINADNEIGEAISPCGGCRQRIAEFGTADTLVHLCNGSGIAETFPLGDLLPRQFSSDDLKLTET